MKKKPLPVAPVHEILLEEFAQYLKVMGYSFGSTLSVRELLWWMEKEEIKLAKIDIKDVEKYYKYLCSRPNKTRPGNLSWHTIDSYFFVIKLFFSYLQKVDKKEVNPMSLFVINPHVRQPKKERNILTKKEIKQLYKVCKNEFEKALLGLCYGCGLRKNEVEKLNLRDVDFGQKCLYVRSGKGKKRRVVPMAEEVVLDVKNYLFYHRPKRVNRAASAADKKALLLNKRGARMKGNSLWASFKTMLLRTGIKKEISLHHLRHSIATHLLAEGMSIEEVRDFLGHEHLESTQIYTRVNQKQLKTIENGKLTIENYGQ